MARVRSRRVFWEAPADSDVNGYVFYVGDPQSGSFLADVDAGQVEPFRELTGTEIILGEGAIDEGNYQFAVCSQDTAGNYSDPYQHPAWQNVPLDLSAPNPPTGGGLEIV